MNWNSQSTPINAKNFGRLGHLGLIIAIFTLLSLDANAFAEESDPTARTLQASSATLPASPAQCASDHERAYVKEINQNTGHHSSDRVANIPLSHRAGIVDGFKAFEKACIDFDSRSLGDQRAGGDPVP